MRIIAGQYGGHKLLLPKGRTIRPTSDKVRGAIFNALTSRIDFKNLCVLDGFCGTGALGLEALSRGADHCVFIDKVQSCLNLARDNAQKTGAIDQGSFIRSDMKVLKPRPAYIKPVGLFFLDPPYGKTLLPKALDLLMSGDWLEADSLGVLEEEKSAAIDIPYGMSIEAQKIYGDTQIVFVRYVRTPK